MNIISSKTGSSSVAKKIGKLLPSGSKEFIDIYAMESQVRNHRAWVQEKSKEIKSHLGLEPKPVRPKRTMLAINTNAT